MPRYEFSLKQKRAMAERSNGVCEAGKFGTHKMYGMADVDVCHRKATIFDHVTATELSQRPILSIEEGLHICGVHDQVKQHKHDRPKINKAKRLREKAAGIKRNSRPIQSRGFGKWKPNVKQISEGWKE